MDVIVENLLITIDTVFVDNVYRHNHIFNITLTVSRKVSGGKCNLFTISACLPSPYEGGDEQTE